MVKNMLDWFIKARGVKYLKPDGGESGGGSSGTSASGGAQKIDLEAIFKEIPLDELDDKTKQTLLKAKEGIATLQKSHATEVESITKQARDFQGQKDRLQQQLETLTGGRREPNQDDYYKVAEDVLKKQGYSAEDIKRFAPVFAETFKSQSEILKKQLGKDLGAMAQSVAVQGAKSAFEEAQETDTTGVMAVPEVAEKVWNATKEHVSKGGVANSAFVLNLAKIAYVDHAESLRKAGKEVPELFKTNGVNNSTFSFPGAGRSSGAARPLGETPRDPQAPKTVLNEDTEAAVAATFKKLGQDTGVYPKAYKPTK